MKNVSQFRKRIASAGVTVAVVALASAAFALGGGCTRGDGCAHAKTDKVRPYPLTTCVVSGEKLDGEMGKPYVFTHQGREIKLCCKSCLKDFNKEPEKYLKQLDEGEKTPSKNAPAHRH
jgi:YHS domain-containing protein